MFTQFPSSLAAGTVEINNTGKVDRIVMIYVPNKDSIPMTIPAGEAINITTTSAGETFTYLSQGDKELTITLTLA